MWLPIEDVPDRPRPEGLDCEASIQGKCESYAIMSRLTTMPSRLSAQPSRLAYAETDARSLDRKRSAMEPWRAWYKTKEWQRLRQQTFIRDGFQCQMVGCGAIKSPSVQLVCDHKTPHRGSRELFFDPANLQTLCKTCHDGAKQRLERGTP